MDDLLVPGGGSSWSWACENDPLNLLPFLLRKSDRLDEASCPDMFGEDGDAKDAVEVAVLLRDRKVKTECLFPCNGPMRCSETEVEVDLLVTSESADDCVEAVKMLFFWEANMTEDSRNDNQPHKSLAKMVKVTFMEYYVTDKKSAASVSPPTLDERTDGMGTVEVMYMSYARNETERNHTVRVRVGALEMYILGPNAFRQASSAGRMHRGADVLPLRVVAVVQRTAYGVRWSWKHEMAVRFPESAKCRAKVLEGRASHADGATARPEECFGPQAWVGARLHRRSGSCAALYGDSLPLRARIDGYRRNRWSTAWKLKLGTQKQALVHAHVASSCKLDVPSRLQSTAEDHEAGLQRGQMLGRWRALWDGPLQSLRTQLRAAVEGARPVSAEGEPGLFLQRVSVGGVVVSWCGLRVAGCVVRGGEEAKAVKLHPGKRPLHPGKRDLHRTKKERPASRKAWPAAALERHHTAHRRLLSAASRPLARNSVQHYVTAALASAPLPAANISTSEGAIVKHLLSSAPRRCTEQEQPVPSRLPARAPGNSDAEPCRWALALTTFSETLLFVDDVALLRRNPSQLPSSSDEPDIPFRPSCCAPGPENGAQRKLTQLSMVPPNRSGLL
ncbi:hypothetical protein PMIN01_08013 [Paraphaeosphaeria minitans]|uniref:Uncharacterized protein n=1 Tax=Paraphaeosphaeria minitans TaxID=565426 RepID=A0A9P6GFY2_9PLEO|nr:hypothetical protein PMIN01_08013 [Paraphaeosphaeria minitans]